MKKTLNISQSSFQKILIDCDVDLSVYNNSIREMTSSSSSSTKDFITFQGELLRGLSGSNIRSENWRASFIPDAHNESLRESQDSSLETSQENVNVNEEENEEELYEGVTPIYADLSEFDFINYASIYFQREKKRIFHSVSLEDMTQYDHRIPLHPLHPIPLKISDIMEVERKILMVMSIISYDDNRFDSEQEQEDRYMQEIVFSSVSSQDYFDEILCYLMKQTNGNPEEDSQIRGYRLLFLLLSLRRPSYHLFHYLLNYIYVQITQSGMIGQIAMAIIKLLLDDSYIPEEQCYNDTKYKEAKKQLNDMNGLSLKCPLKKLKGCGLQEVIDMENLVYLLLKHGILPPTKMSYAWKCIIRRFYDFSLFEFSL